MIVSSYIVRIYSAWIVQSIGCIDNYTHFYRFFGFKSILREQTLKKKLEQFAGELLYSALWLVLENSCHSVSQSDTNLITRVFPCFGQFALTLALKGFSTFLIGRCDYLGFGFKTQNPKALKCWNMISDAEALFVLELEKKNNEIKTEVFTTANKMIILRNNSHGGIIKKKMDNSLKWVLFIKVSGQITSDTLC